jgi:hypothetical protein
LVRPFTARFNCAFETKPAPFISGKTARLVEKSN